MTLRFNVDVSSFFAARRNHALEEVLQLSEIEAGLGLLTPADQHQLIPVVMTIKSMTRQRMWYSINFYPKRSVTRLQIV